MKAETDADMADEFNDDDNENENDGDDDNYESGSQENGMRNDENRTLFFVSTESITFLNENYIVLFLLCLRHTYLPAQKNDADGFDKPKLATPAELGIHAVLHVILLRNLFDLHFNHFEGPFRFNSNCPFELLSFFK